MEEIQIKKEFQLRDWEFGFKCKKCFRSRDCTGEDAIINYSIEYHNAPRITLYITVCCKQDNCGYMHTRVPPIRIPESVCAYFWERGETPGTPEQEKWLVQDKIKDREQFRIRCFYVLVFILFVACFIYAAVNNQE